MTDFDDHIAAIVAAHAADQTSLATAQAQVDQLTKKGSDDDTLIAGLQQTITSLQAQLAGLQQPSTPGVWTMPAYKGVPSTYATKAISVPALGNPQSAIIGVGKSAVALLEPGTYEFVDFKQGDQATIGLVVRAGGLAGHGAAPLLRMKANSSTVVPGVTKLNNGTLKVPPQSTSAAGGINQLYLVLANKDLNGDDWYLGNLIFEGTPQQSMYHGLAGLGIKNLLWENLLVRGIIGSSSANPGETYHFQLTGGTARWCEADGQNVGGSGFYIGGALPIVLDHCNAKDMGHGHGITGFAVNSAVTITEAVISNVAVPLNFEAGIGGTITITHATTLGARSKAKTGGGAGLPIFGLHSSASGSNVVHYTDPMQEGQPISATNKLRLAWDATYPDKTGKVVPNTQRQSDVHLTVAGQERPEWIAWSTGRVGAPGE